jgi:hypothetical protein
LIYRENNSFSQNLKFSPLFTLCVLWAVVVCGYLFFQYTLPALIGQFLVWLSHFAFFKNIFVAMPWLVKSIVLLLYWGGELLFLNIIFSLFLYTLLNYFADVGASFALYSKKALQSALRLLPLQAVIALPLLVFSAYFGSNDIFLTPYSKDWMTCLVFALWLSTLLLFVSADCANIRFADTLKAIAAIYKKNASVLLSFFLIFWFAGWASAQIVFAAGTAFLATAAAMSAFGFFLSMLIVGMSFYYLVKISSILNEN